MSPSEIGSNSVTGLEKLVLYVVMHQVHHHSSADVSNIPVLNLIFLEAVSALPK